MDLIPVEHDPFLAAAQSPEPGAFQRSVPAPRNLTFEQRAAPVTKAVDAGTFDPRGAKNFTRFVPVNHDPFKVK